MTLPSRIAGALAKLPPAHTYEVSVERDLVSKMPDGAELLADRWYPTNVGAGLPPTVLLRSPYGRRPLGMFGRLFAERGYQVVIQSCRGTFGSGGDWEPFRNEERDGKATHEWVASQPWFDGQLVTFGPSYLGLTQWFVAQDPPAYLKAMALTVTASKVSDAIIYPGGTLGLESLLTWVNTVDSQEQGLVALAKAQRRTPKAVAAAAQVLPLNQGDQRIVGHPVAFYQDWISHNEPGDEWWDVVDHSKDRTKIPAATLVGGWYDLFLVGQVADFEALVAAGRSARLTVGPWSHASLGGVGASLRDALAFFDEQLKGRKPEPDPVRLFVMGSKEWRTFAQWPPRADQQKWYLGSGGTLSPDGVASGPADRYRYDPSDPTPGLGGPSLLGSAAGPKDQKPRETRRDVVTYTSVPMRSDLTVVGPLTATLHLRSSLEHTDFFVRLCDVDAKGKSTNLADGIKRLTPGTVTKTDDGTFELQVSMWPTANTFKAGHRVRLQVSSGAHPLFARNPGSGEPLGTATTLVPADQEIWHDETHESFILLPVVGSR
jgi:putative CocE/NonD family hydrolase